MLGIPAQRGIVPTRRSVALWAGVVFSVSACGGESGGSGGTPPTPVAASVVVTAAASGALVSLGETRAVSAVVRDAAQSAIATAPVTWTTSNASVATVAGTGATATVTATGNGTAIISATSGAVSGTVQVDVTQRFTQLVVSAGNTTLAIGATTALTASARDARGNPIAGVSGATFTAGDRSKGLVDAAGLVTAIAPGAAPFTASLTRDGVTASGNVSVTITAPAAGVSAATVQATDASIFTPPAATVLEGGTITWSFGTLPHNVTFQAAGAPTNIGVTSSASASRVFGAVGTYPYTCTLHAGMNGTVTVVAGALFTQMNGANERPNPVTTTANGAAVFTRSGTTMNYVVTYQGIASNPTGMHIHAPAGPSGTAGIIVDLMRTPLTSTSGVLTGSFTATDIRGIAGQPPISLDSLSSLLRNGQGYVNVHSSTYPAGEIRGQLSLPPG